jgi:hypothetical protein
LFLCVNPHVAEAVVPFRSPAVVVPQLPSVVAALSDTTTNHRSPAGSADQSKLPTGPRPQILPDSVYAGSVASEP